MSEQEEKGGDLQGQEAPPWVSQFLEQTKQETAALRAEIAELRSSHSASGQERDDRPRIAGTSIPQPENWDYMDDDQKLAYVHEQSRYENEQMLNQRFANSHMVNEAIQQQMAELSPEGQSHFKNLVMELQKNPQQMASMNEQAIALLANSAEGMAARAARKARVAEADDAEKPTSVQTMRDAFIEQFGKAMSDITTDEELEAMYGGN